MVKSSRHNCQCKNGIKHLIKSWKELGMIVDLPALGPWVIGDNVDFNVAIGMLKYA